MVQENHRRHKRFSVDGIHGNVLYTSDIEVLNISMEGIAVETAKRLELNREYTFKVRYGDTFLNLKGHVVWAILMSKEKSDTGTTVPVYRAGIKFSDTLGEKASLLQCFIEEKKVKTLESRLGGVRFKIANSEDVKVDLRHKYEVKKISLSGMLVETEYPLELDSRHEIELFLNDTMMNLVGRVAFCRTIGTDEISMYDIGIEFVEMSDNDKKSMKHFLNTFADE